MSCHSGRSAEKKKRKKERRGARNRGEIKTERVERWREGRREGGVCMSKGRENSKGEDLCRLESIRLVRERLNVT